MEFITNQPFQEALLLKTLKQIFGVFDQSMLQMIMPEIEWLAIHSGEMLFHQGEQSDALYFLLSGRLRVFVIDENGRQKNLGKIMRGETVGEMAVFTGEPRTANVEVVRDGVLVKMSKEIFEKTLNAYPLIAMNVSKLIINRLQHSNRLHETTKKPINICLLGIVEHLDLLSFATSLLPHLMEKGHTTLLSSSIVNDWHNSSSIAYAVKGVSDEYTKLSLWLDEKEIEYDFVLFVADPTDTEWTQRCIRYADEVFLLTDANEKPDLTEIEKKYLNQNNKITGAAQILLLLHDQNTQIPENTTDWLNPRSLQTHIHLKLSQNAEQQYKRLARIISHTSVGLVLSGGGARGLAHLGAIKALKEAGLYFDYIGGTSIGSMMGVLVACDIQIDEIIDTARKTFSDNPTSDYNFFPFISILKGKKMRRRLAEAIHTYMKPNADITDTWLNYYCVTSNLTQAKEQVHFQGDIIKYIIASSSIPGALPPMIDGGDLLIDGGIFNNFPADVMNNCNVKKIIGVGLSEQRAEQFEDREMPNSWQLLRDRFRNDAKKKYDIPSIMSIILRATMLSSEARRKITEQHIDLKLCPDASQYGLFAWKSIDEIVEIGYLHTKEKLSTMSEEELAYLK